MIQQLTILLFAPHSAIWVHAFPEALIAETLQQAGHRLIYIGCGEVFKDYCICMSGLDSSSSKIEKQKICNICSQQKNIIRENFGFTGYDLKDMVSDLEYKQITEIVRQTNPQNFLDLKIDNIEIGRNALYETLLRYKKNSLTFSEIEWNGYLIALKNTLVSFFACRNILDREKPDRVLTYNSLYSVNRTCCQLSEFRGIPTYFLHAGDNLSNRLQTMLIGEGNTLKFSQRIKDYWPIYKEIPCSSESLQLVTNHFLELFKGNHFLAYSSSRTKQVDIYDLFRIHKDQKLLIATMSSYDEMFAAETTKILPKNNNLIFPHQIDWIQSLIEFVKNRQDLFLIIRVHPREWPNKRDSVRSEHSKMLERVLIDLPSNIKLNLPEDNISIYNLAEYADLFLNAWSSAGEEMSLFGIPVLIYSPELVLYPSDINYLAISKEDFFDKIDIALDAGWSFEKIRVTYRWYVLKYVRSVFNLSESVKWHQKSPYSREIKSKKRLANTIDFMYKLFNRVYFKILSKLTKNHVNYRNRLEDCRQRVFLLKDSKKITELIQDQKKILLDLTDNDLENKLGCSVDLETSFIKHEISRMFQGLFDIEGIGENNIKSPLRENLSNAVKSRIRPEQ